MSIFHSLHRSTSLLTVLQPGVMRTVSAHPLPLTTSKLVNRFGVSTRTTVSHGRYTITITIKTDRLLQPAKMEVPVDELLQKLSIQQNLLSRQQRDLAQNENGQPENGKTENGVIADRSTSSSSPTDLFPEATPPTDDDEVLELKKQLGAAKEHMALMNLELTQSRLAQHTMEEAIGSPFPGAQHLAVNINGHNMLPGARNITALSTQDNSRAGSFVRGGFNPPQLPQRPS